MVKQSQDKSTGDMFTEEQSYIVRNALNLYIKKLERAERSAENPTIAGEYRNELVKVRKLMETFK